MTSITVRLILTAASVLLAAAGLIQTARSPLPAPTGALAAVVLAALSLLCLLSARRVRLRAPGAHGAEEGQGDQLARLAGALGEAQTAVEVGNCVEHVLAEIVGAPRAILLRRLPGDHFEVLPAPATGKKIMTIPPALLARLDRGGVVSRNEWGMAAREPVWRHVELDATAIVPVGTPATALIAVGSDRPARRLRTREQALLGEAAGLVALALARAGTYEQLEAQQTTNQRLARELRERTAASENTAEELHQSLTALRGAYQQLEESHANLMRADRLASLGRLTAGLAHEINTPLSAVLNSLKMITDLGREYDSSVEDPKVSAADHHEIAREIVTHAQSAMQWVQKAAAFIRNVKTQGRVVGESQSRPFLIRDAVTEVQQLMGHRLSASTCRVEFSEEPSGIGLVGSPSRFGQMLVNLVTNAIDAYEDAGISDGRIEIQARRTTGAIEVTVRDAAGGIPVAALPRIFEGLFTTKGPGRGTGLGLWIARNVVEEGFGGRLDVLTNPGLGSCFTAAFPLEAQAAETDPTQAQAA
jgi:signal transduction histidine kinase